MRLALDPRARRLLRRLPRNTVYSAMELVLLSLLAIQCARLVWTLVTPLGPVGDWKAGSALRPVTPGASAVLDSFDPFFRLSGGTAAPVVVTSLNLKLFGVREDRASGRGSAIIGTPDGQQRSFAVGEEIVPGVRLMAVGPDSVTVSRGGAAEQLFLDQSTPAAVVAAPGAGPALPASPPPPPEVAPPPPPVGMMRTGAIPPPPWQILPRVEDSQVTGITIRGSSGALREAGIQPGDVVTSVNGQRITSVEQARTAAARIEDGGGVNIEVERGARTISLRVGTDR